MIGGEAVPFSYRLQRQLTPMKRVELANNLRPLPVPKEVANSQN